MFSGGIDKQHLALMVGIRLLHQNIYTRLQNRDLLEFLVFMLIIRMLKEIDSF